MTTTSLPRLRRTFTVALALLAMIAVGTVTVQSSAHAGTSEGLQCEYGTTSSQAVPTSRTFSLTATTGYISTPDGNTHLHVGLRRAVRDVPAARPDAVRQPGRHRHGEPEEPAAGSRSPIVFPGQTGVTADGVPAQPVFDGTNTMTSMVQPRGQGQHGDLLVRGLPARHVPLRERHGRRQAGADGPVRRAGGPAGQRQPRGHGRPRLRQRRHPASPPATSTSTCCPRSTRPCTRRWSGGGCTTRRSTGPATS